MQNMPIAPTPPTFPHISPADAAAMLAAGALIIDVRTPQEFAAGHLPHAHNLPLPQLTPQIRRLAQPGATILLYCSQGHRSRSAALVLARLGYKNLYIIK